MTISTAPSSARIDHNQQTFDTCLSLALQLVASIEYGPATGGDAPPTEMLLDFARELDRHAEDIARLAGREEVNLPGLGLARYQELRAGGALPLHVAYRALHTAAFLGLDGGHATAVMLSVVSCGVRELTLTARTYH